MNSLLETLTSTEIVKFNAPEVTQTDRHYYYRPCAYNNGATLKCAGHGAEDPSHRAFYLPHFDKADDGRHLLTGTLVLEGYHGDQIEAEYAKANSI